MALLNKNNQRVKLADGLTEIGLSQVKSEIGGNEGQERKKLIVEESISSDGYFVLCNPVTLKAYLDATVESIANDYGFTYVPAHDLAPAYLIIENALLDVYCKDDDLSFIKENTIVYQGTTQAILIINNENEQRAAITNVLFSQLIDGPISELLLWDVSE